MHGFSVRSILTFMAAMAASSCASQADPPGPGEARGGIPDLRGRTVLVLPIQLNSGVPQGVLADAELAHALRTRGESVTWVFPPETEDALRRSPGVQARIRDLPVGMFLQAEVDRIGDPLFGTIRRLAALTGAEVALIPVQLKYGEEGAYQIAMAILNARTGRVSWFGVVEGEAGGAESPLALASVAEAIARAVLPLG